MTKRRDLNSGKHRNKYFTSKTIGAQYKAQFFQNVFLHFPKIIVKFTSTRT